MPGSGTMTPITGGVPGGSDVLFQPLPYTLLSVHRYAKVMGISPLHFAGASAYNLVPQVFPVVSCDTIYYKYDWQSIDKVSRLQIAESILSAESDIASVVGYWPAPTWITDEEHRYISPYRRGYVGNGIGADNRIKTVSTKYGKILGVGRRAVSLVGTATTLGGSLTYTDEDSDGYYETATIQLATLLTDVNDIKVYYTGTGGSIDYEIRPPRSKSISGGNLTIVMDSWLLIDPVLYEAYKTEDGPDAIDVSTIANFVDTVDVYREYADTTQASARFYWDTYDTICTTCGGTGCEVCNATTLDGCAHVRKSDAGIVAPYPATYDSTNAKWIINTSSGYPEPDTVHLWYRAGDVDQRYASGVTTDPLSYWWAQTIAWIATARLDRPFCECGSVTAIAEQLREDLGMSNTTRSFFLPESIVNNPFGTRRGEIMAWKRVRSLAKKVLSVAVV